MKRIRIVFGTLKCRAVLNMSVAAIFIDCFIHSGATWWKTTTCFLLT